MGTLRRLVFASAISLVVFLAISYGWQHNNTHYDDSIAHKCAVCGRPAHWYFYAISPSSRTYSYDPSKTGDEQAKAAEARNFLGSGEKYAERLNAKRDAGYYCDEHKSYLARPAYLPGMLLAFVPGLFTFFKLRQLEKH